MKKLKIFIKLRFPWAVKIYHQMIKVINIITNNIYNFIDNPIIILLYHRVIDIENDNQLLAVSVKNFEEHIKFLSENYNILSFEKEWGKVSKPSVIITFDDGYADNYYNALPILERYKVPATIFVATQNIDTNKEFWFDCIENYFFNNENLPNSIKLNIAKKTFEFSLKNDNEIKDSYAAIHLLLKNLLPDERKKVLDELKKVLNFTGMDRKKYRTLNSAELRMLDNSNYISVGAHTVSHTKLSLQSYDEQYEEIRNSKIELEKILNHKIIIFSYPFGTKDDYNKDSIKILKNLKIKKAASNFYGQVHSWNTNTYEYPRYIVRNWKIEEFKNRIEQFFVES